MWNEERVAIEKFPRGGFEDRRQILALKSRTGDTNSESHKAGGWVGKQVNDSKHESRTWVKNPSGQKWIGFQDWTENTTDQRRFGEEFTADQRRFGEEFTADQRFAEEFTADQRRFGMHVWEEVAAAQSGNGVKDSRSDGVDKELNKEIN